MAVHGVCSPYDFLGAGGHQPSVTKMVVPTCIRNKITEASSVGPSDPGAGPAMPHGAPSQRALLPGPQHTRYSRHGVEVQHDTVFDFKGMPCPSFKSHWVLDVFIYFKELERNLIIIFIFFKMKNSVEP